ncbi:hypothetical protein DFH09DRAFT_1419222 [Mycena vulgaris]|nr:hypothetical protein DFH09DRAFT_1419222 [Mycena vulgaris]
MHIMHPQPDPHIASWSKSRSALHLCRGYRVTLPGYIYLRFTIIALTCRSARCLGPPCLPLESNEKHRLALALAPARCASIDLADATRSTHSRHTALYITLGNTEIDSWLNSESARSIWISDDALWRSSSCCPTHSFDSSTSLSTLRLELDLLGHEENMQHCTVRPQSRAISAHVDSERAPAAPSSRLPYPSCPSCSYFCPPSTRPRPRPRGSWRAVGVCARGREYDIAYECRVSGGGSYVLSGSEEGEQEEGGDALAVGEGEKEGEPARGARAAARRGRGKRTPTTRTWGREGVVNTLARSVENTSCSSADSGITSVLARRLLLAGMGVETMSASGSRSPSRSVGLRVGDKGEGRRSKMAGEAQEEGGALIVRGRGGGVGFVERESEGGEEGGGAAEEVVLGVCELGRGWSRRGEGGDELVHGAHQAQALRGVHHVDRGGSALLIVPVKCKTDPIRRRWVMYGLGETGVIAQIARRSIGFLAVSAKGGGSLCASFAEVLWKRLPSQRPPKDSSSPSVVASHPLDKKLGSPRRGLSSMRATKKPRRELEAGEAVIDPSIDTATLPRLASHYDIAPPQRPLFALATPSLRYLHPLGGLSGETPWGATGGDKMPKSECSMFSPLPPSVKLYRIIKPFFSLDAPSISLRNVALLAKFQNCLDAGYCYAPRNLRHTRLAAIAPLPARTYLSFRMHRVARNPRSYIPATDSAESYRPP